MRHAAKLAAAGLTAALLATACGGVTNVLQGKSPSQIIQLASTRVTGESYRMTITGGMTVDASGVQGIPSSVLDPMTSAMGGMTIDGKADVQSAQRLRMTMTFSIAGTTKTIVAVLYDGHYYVSMDNDNRFADAGTLNLQGATVSPDDLKSVLTGATDVKDLGSTVHDGQRVDHLHATLGSDYVSRMMSRIGGSGSGAAAMQQLASLFKEVLSVRNGTVDVYVRDLDGRVEAMDTNMTMAMDMGKFMAMLMQQYGGQLGTGNRMPDVTGSLLMTVKGSNRFSDYGARFSISKPAVDPNAPSLPSNLFFGGGGA